MYEATFLPKTCCANKYMLLQQASCYDSSYSLEAGTDRAGAALHLITLTHAFNQTID